MLVAYVFNAPFGANNEGDVIQLDPEEAQPLVDAGVIAEATQEHLSGTEEEEESPGDEMQEAALSKQLRALSQQITKLGGNLHENAVKATESAVNKILAKQKSSFSIPATPKSDEEVFRSPGEAMYHMWKANRTGDVRSKNMLREYSKKSPLGMAESSTSLGAYDIKKDYLDHVYKKLRQYPKLIEMTNVVPAKSKTFDIPYVTETSLSDSGGTRHGGVTGYWTAEAATITSSYPAGNVVTASLQTLFVLSFVTQQLLDDANIEAIDKLISEMALLEILFKQNQAFISGSGSGEPLGLANQPAKYTVPKSSSDAASGGVIGFDDLAAMEAHLWPGSRGTAVWIMNPQLLSRLRTLAFPNTAGTYPAYGLTYDIHEDFKYRLFGYPIIECLNCAQAGAEGDVYLVDPKVLFTYQYPGIQIDVSNEYAFTTAQNAYRFLYRADIKSGWQSSVTAADGNWVYSPILSLQARGT